MDKSNLKITDDPYFNNFIKSKKLSESTKIVYSGRLKAFCDFLGKNPSELIEDAQKASRQDIDEYFTNYIESLKESDKSSNTIVNRIDTVKAFYNEYNIDIDIEGINRIIFPDINNLNFTDIISQDQIQEALEVSSPRDKAIILLYMSSGMEAAELRHLTYGDFLNSIQEYIDLKPEEKFDLKKIENKLLKMDQIVGTWKIEKIRTGKSYVTFNSPESTIAIIRYLNDRERKNKSITSMKDPLFVNSQNKSLSVFTHGSIFKRINNRANFGYITEKRRFFSSTMLRKYFKAKLHESGVDEATVNAFLGQNLNMDIEYNSEAEITYLKNVYLKSVKNLSLKQADIETISSEAYNALIQELNEKNKELEEIKKHLHHIKQIL
jgi:site-specific recombinase XerD